MLCAGYSYISQYIYVAPFFTTHHFTILVVAELSTQIVYSMWKIAQK